MTFIEDIYVSKIESRYYSLFMKVIKGRYYSSNSCTVVKIFYEQYSMSNVLCGIKNYLSIEVN